MGKAARIHVERFKIEHIAGNGKIFSNNYFLKKYKLKAETMSWYSKYLSVYNKTFDEIPSRTLQEIREKLQRINQSEQPLVSVVVIAHNEEKHLAACLWSLSDSLCRYPMEIIGVDNSSTDRTADIYKASGIPYYNETRKSCGYARRCGLEQVRGKYYICIDSDTMYPPLLRGDPCPKN